MFEAYNQALEEGKIKRMLKKLPREKIIEIYGAVMSELDEEKIKNILQKNENKNKNQAGSNGNAGGPGGVHPVLGSSNVGLLD